MLRYMPPTLRSSPVLPKSDTLLPLLKSSEKETRNPFLPMLLIFAGKCIVNQSMSSPFCSPKWVRQVVSTVQVDWSSKVASNRNKLKMFYVDTWSNTSPAKHANRRIHSSQRKIVSSSWLANRAAVDGQLTQSRRVSKHKLGKGRKTRLDDPDFYMFSIRNANLIGVHRPTLSIATTLFKLNGTIWT